MLVQSAVFVVFALLVDATTAKKLTSLKVVKCEDYDGDHVFHLNKLGLSPYPVELPSNITVNVDMEMEHLVLGPFDVEVKIYRDLFVWVKVPCLDGVGSCTYKNICQHPEGTDSQKKIEAAFGFPLQGCIIPKFKLNLTVNDIVLPDLSGIVDFLAGGDYKIQATVSNKDKKLTCIQIFAEVD